MYALLLWITTFGDERNMIESSHPPVGHFTDSTTLINFQGTRTAVYLQSNLVDHACDVTIKDTSYL